jgi:hypothetical protein
MAAVQAHGPVEHKGAAEEERGKHAEAEQLEHGSWGCALFGFALFGFC